MTACTPFAPVRETTITSIRENLCTHRMGFLNHLASCASSTLFMYKFTGMPRQNGGNAAVLPDQRLCYAEAAILRRASPANPITPLPKSQAAAGMGTGALADPQSLS